MTVNRKTCNERMQYTDCLLRTACMNHVVLILSTESLQI